MSKSILLIVLYSVLVSTCHAQNGGPIVKVYAYEREMSPGIPPGGPGIASSELQGKQYSLYLETKDPSITVEGVWMKGQFHTVETALKTAPIIMSSPVAEEPNSKNTLVPRTSNAVIEVIVGEKVKSNPPTGDLARLLKNNAAVIELTDKGKPVSVSVPAFAKQVPILLQ